MKILSIIGLLASLALMVTGFVVSQITCYNSSRYSNSIPDDADTWGYCIIAMGVFFFVYSIAGLKKK